MNCFSSILSKTCPAWKYRFSMEMAPQRRVTVKGARNSRAGVRMLFPQRARRRADYHILTQDRSMKASVFLLAFACAASAHGNVKLPALFSDHMVVQADASVPVWGWADPGEEVTLSLGTQ